jgi:hypothetical protein
MLVRSSEGVCICCGLPLSDLKNFGQQNVRTVMRELELQFRGKLRYCYKQFPGYMQRSHIIHLHMERFIEKHVALKIEEPIAEMTDVQRTTQKLMVQNIDLGSFAISYAESMSEIHLEVKKPFSANATETNKDQLRDNEEAPLAWLGYNERLRAETDMVTICDENCNRAQTSNTHFFHDAIPPLVITDITTKIELMFDDFRFSLPYTST